LGEKLLGAIGQLGRCGMAQSLLGNVEQWLCSEKEGHPRPCTADLELGSIEISMAS
jgi:hypothetical protein